MVIQFLTTEGEDLLSLQIHNRRSVIALARYDAELSGLEFLSQSNVFF